MEANKEESERCIEIARKSLKEKNVEKALKFLSKAQKLNPQDKKIDDLIRNLNDIPTQNGSATGDYGAFTDQYENTPRSRFHSSKSQPNFAKQNSAPSQNGAAEASSSSGDDERKATNVNRQRSKSRNRTSSTSAGSGGGAAGVNHRTTSSPQLGVDYTQDQMEAVQRVRRCKDYYEILNVKKDFNDSDLKKQYRKLALQFHPDKNRAPGATEAFKAIGNAYAVLSEPKKRERYDMYGTETQSSSNSHRHEYDYNRGFEADMTAEEIFNMFFGGGFPQGNLRRRQPGHFYYQHSANDERRNESSLGVLLQLMPILILIFLSVFSQLLVADPPFSLHRNGKYSEERRTVDLGVLYYVKQDFNKQYDKNIGRVEQQVEEEYVDNLRNSCFRERSQKETMMWRAKLYGDAHLYEKAQNLRTPSCDRLAEIYR